MKEIADRIGEEDPREFFIRRLIEGIGRIAAAFYPKPVIVRISDFKTNEYAMLLGGEEFEPTRKIRCSVFAARRVITTLDIAKALPGMPGDVTSARRYGAG